MNRLKYSCYTWAKKQTGFDPMQQPTASAPPPEKKGGAVKGAAIGAATGGVIGGVRRNKSNKVQEQYAQQQSAQYEQKRNEYNRAWGACLEGKGYTVK